MSRAYAAWLAVALAAALAIGISGGNVAGFRAIQAASRVVPAPLFEAFWQSVTYAGDGLAVFAIAAVVLWQRPSAAWAGIIAAVPGSMVMHALKALIPVDRPALVLMNDGITVLGPALQHGSFPSGHSVAAGILAGTVYLAYREFTGLSATSKYYLNRSDDGGLTYGPAVVAAVGGNTTGNIDVDQRDGTLRRFEFRLEDERVFAITPPRDARGIGKRRH